MTYEIDTSAKTIKLTSNVTFKEVRELEKMFPGFTLAPANTPQWWNPTYVGGGLTIPCTGDPVIGTISTYCLSGVEGTMAIN